MFRLVICGIFLLASCSTKDESKRSSDERAVHRNKRTGPMFFTTGAVTAGLRIVRKLLKDTKPLPTSLLFNNYRKSGGLKQAMADFNGVTKSSKAKQSPLLEPFDSVSTEVGDRILVLKSRGETGLPEMEIMKYVDNRNTGRHISGGKINRIIYTDN